MVSPHHSSEQSSEDKPDLGVLSTATFSAENSHTPDVLSSSKPNACSEPLVYSHFTKLEKRIIVSLITFAAIFSPLSSFIFFPAINMLAKDLHVSVERINLTITSYMVIAGLAPAMIGDMADMTGRRIVYLMTMLVYCAANVGLALQNSWTALFILRMLQSAGGAATIAIGYGVVSDIASPAERGGFVGVMLMGPNLATAIGPVLGGSLSLHPGWRWIFWLLAISSGTCLVLILLFLPETSRLTVGNGLGKVAGLHRTLFSLLFYRKKPKFLETASGVPQNAITRIPFHIPNVLTSLKLLWARDTALITLIYGVYYMNFSCLQASMSLLFIKLYGLSQIQAGLVYLPFGVGAFTGAYCSGKVMDRDYHLTARSHNIVVNVEKGDDLTIFPIEKARFRSIWISIVISGGCTIGYGWAVHSAVHLAVPLILQFLTGFFTILTFNFCGTLLVDLHPKSPAAAQAANNIMRCSLAAGGLAVLQILLDTIGIGWTFTIFGALDLGCLVAAWLEWSYGKSWTHIMRESNIER